MSERSNGDVVASCRYVRSALMVLPRPCDRTLQSNARTLVGDAMARTLRFRRFIAAASRGLSVPTADRSYHRTGDDRADPGLNAPALPRRAKNRGPLQAVPVMARAMADRLG